MMWKQEVWGPLSPDFLLEALGQKKAIGVGCEYFDIFSPQPVPAQTP